ncbi:hypothetical protein D2U88_06545 [Flagellimonas aequoris]|uniref:Uncharacterized protein n=1 Tax=Flagellimonas aequoris TaxID=2306997 RepID=A0A418N9M1_9FLAO|nr:hypothetical protein D2U88_06545 [Allomuricauda aequoris]
MNGDFLEYLSSIGLDYQLIGIAMKNYVLLFLMILNVGLLSAQCSKKEKCLKKDSTAIVLNPFGENQIPKCVCYRSWVKYKINNVNNILVNGVSESESTNIDFEIPEMITNALKKAEKDKNGSAELYAPEVSDVDFLSELKQFVQYFRKIEGYTQLEGQLVALLNDHLFIENADVFKKHAGSMVQSHFDEDSIPLELYKKLPKTLNSLDAAYFQLKKLYEEINAMKEIGTMSVVLTFDSGEKRNIESMAIVEVGQPKFKAEYDFVKKAYEELHKKENKQNLENKVNAGIRLYQKIKDACFTIYGDAGQAMGDIFTTKIALKNAKGDTLHTYKPITIRTRGGFKVNFSSGYLLSFKGNDSYSSFRTDGSSATSIKADNKDKMTHALGALCHVYFRGIHDLQPGISAGLSVEDDADLGFYLGLSALFTESNRLVFTAGVSMTKIDKLNTANLSDANNGIRTFLSEDNTNINYDKVYRPAFFVGVTFNLSKQGSTKN